MVDGEPNSHGELTAFLIEELVGEACRDNDGGRDCLLKLSEFLATQDLAPHLPGEQTVTIHAIAIADDTPILSEITEISGGQHLFIRSSSELKSALDTIALEIENSNR